MTSLIDTDFQQPLVTRVKTTHSKVNPTTIKPNRLRDDAIVGRCEFVQLPKRYQEAFTQGANHVAGALFIRESHPWSELILMPFFLLLAACPILVVREVDSVDFAPWGPPALAILLVAIALSCRCVWGCFKSISMRRRGCEIYGLLLDNENLVVRSTELWTVQNCVILPREKIVKYELTYERYSSTGGRVSKTPIITAICKQPNGQQQRIRIGQGDWLAEKSRDVLAKLNGCHVEFKNNSRV